MEPNSWSSSKSGKWPIVIFLFALLLLGISATIRFLKLPEPAAIFLSFIAKTILLLLALTFLFLIARRILRVVFFKVRNRIIANYILTGILPLCLLLGLVVVGAVPEGHIGHAIVKC